MACCKNGFVGRGGAAHSASKGSPPRDRARIESGGALVTGGGPRATRPNHWSGAGKSWGTETGTVGATVTGSSDSSCKPRANCWHMAATWSSGSIGGSSGDRGIKDATGGCEFWFCNGKELGWGRRRSRLLGRSLIRKDICLLKGEL